jgi:DNA-binding XRE family transcriptional regulator
MPVMDARHYFPEKLTELRAKAEPVISQEALAVEFGVHKMTILRAEKGRSANYELLVKYATRFNVAVTDLLRPHPVTSTQENSRELAEAAL